MLRGSASFVDEEGVKRIEKFGPEEKTVDASEVGKNQYDSMFAFLKPNTNYTARVCAVTRRRECGKPAMVSCKMPSMPPNLNHMSRFQWDNGQRNGREVFRLKTPRLSERDGAICCFRVIVVRMRKGSDLNEINDRNNLKIHTYRKAHETSDSWGAYVAEILGPNTLGEDVFVGDGQNILAASSASGGSQCPACHTGVHAHLLSVARKAENLRVVRYVFTFTTLFKFIS